MYVLFWSSAPQKVFEFWHFPPTFVLLKVTCLVTLTYSNVNVASLGWRRGIPWQSVLSICNTEQKLWFLLFCTLITLMPAGIEKASLFSRLKGKRKREKKSLTCLPRTDWKQIINTLCAAREKAFSTRCQEMESEASIEVLHANAVSWASVAVAVQQHTMSKVQFLSKM